MARKKEVFIATEGRDKGKKFIITEMSAYRAEKWAFRALLALAHAGADVTEEEARSGMHGIAQAGLKSLQKLDPIEAEPLLEEMLTCVEIEPDPVNNKGFVRPIILGLPEGDDIDEIMTLIDLRTKIFQLHTAFFLKGSGSKTA